jgi:hypothetical protein
MRNFRIVAALVATVCVAFAVVGGASAHGSKSSPYFCAYGKKAGKLGTVYLMLDIRPKSVGPAFCKAFNGSFKGTQRKLPAQLGTGKIYCAYNYKKSSLDVSLGVFADKATGGKAFCKVFKPGKDWKRIA